MKFDIHHIVCSCNSADHTVRIINDGEDFYIEVQLHQTKNILKRILAAIKYVFGYECKYGHWDVTLLSKDESKKLYYYLKKHKDNITDA